MKYAKLYMSESQTIKTTKSQVSKVNIYTKMSIEKNWLSTYLDLLR